MALIKLIQIELCKFISSGIAPNDYACVCMYAPMTLLTTVWKFETRGLVGLLA